MKVYLTGGSGFIGQRIIHHLKEAGHEVVAMARSDSSAAAVEALGANAAKGDLGDVAAMSTGMDGCEAVLHVAGHIKVWDKYDAFAKTNIEGTANCLAAAQAAGVKRFIYMSTASVIVPEEREEITGADESAPTQTPEFSPYIATKTLAEREVQAAADKLDVIILRPPMVWGPNDMFAKNVSKRIAAGEFAMVSGGEVELCSVHVDNLAEAARCALTEGKSGSAYFINDDGTLIMKEFIANMCKQLGITPPGPIPAVPYEAAWEKASMAEAKWVAEDLPGEPPLSRTMVRLMGETFTTTDAAARSELGYKPVVSRAQGLAEYH